MKQFFATLFAGGFLWFAAGVSVHAESAFSDGQDEVANTEASAIQSKSEGVIHLNKESFINLVFDFETQSEWKYKGEKPAILDFYADWCAPCRKLSPVLEQLQLEYDGKLQVYKIDTERSRELAAAFGIRSLPTIVFVPLNEEPRAVMGYVPKEELEKMITEHLKVNK